MSAIDYRWEFIKANIHCKLILQIPSKSGKILLAKRRMSIFPGINEYIFLPTFREIKKCIEKYSVQIVPSRKRI